MIERISSGGLFEKKVGYCRAVVAGGFVYVSGTVAGPEVPNSVLGQCESVLSNIDQALRRAGSGFEKTVKVTYYLPKASDFEVCWPILQKTFGDNPPAATMIVCGLIDPKYKIEIELTAIL